MSPDTGYLQYVIIYSCTAANNESQRKTLTVESICIGEEVQAAPIAKSELALERKDLVKIAKLLVDH